jgi:hypothetical protein
MLVGFINIDFKTVWSVPDVMQNCGVADQEVGTCLKTDTSDPNNPDPFDPLNCVYCAVYDMIGDDPFLIPSGQHFVRINLALDYCFCGNKGPCGYNSGILMARYWYGTPVFRQNVRPEDEDPLYTDLDVF